MTWHLFLTSGVPLFTITGRGDRNTFYVITHLNVFLLFCYSSIVTDFMHRCARALLRLQTSLLSQSGLDSTEGWLHLVDHTCTYQHYGHTSIFLNLLNITEEIMTMSWYNWLLFSPIPLLH